MVNLFIQTNVVENVMNAPESKMAI